MSKLFIFILTFSFLISCSEQQLKENERIIDRFENGNIKTKKILISKTDTTNYEIVEYFENGSIYSKGHMKDSMIVGYWETYYNNGQLREKGNYIIDDSLNEGKYTRSYFVPLKDKTGKIMKEHTGWMCSMEMRERESKNLHVCKNGYWEYYFENGNLKTKGTYNNGWCTDKWVEYYENGNMKLESLFKGKKKAQNWNYWYENGRKMKEVLYQDSLELFLQAWDSFGVHKVINGNGQFREPSEHNKAEITLSTYKNGILNGDYIHYFDDGKIEEKGQYLNGKSDGKWIYHFACVFPCKLVVRNFKNGIENGYCYTIEPNGDTTDISFYSDGLEHGYSKQYKNRILILIDPWNMGQHHGIRKYYNELTGKPELFQYFYYDEEVGDEKYENGILIKRTIYEGEEKKFKALMQ